MRVLVTGGTGFIGRSLVGRLVLAGHDTTILVEETAGPRQPLPPSIEKFQSRIRLIYGDLRRRDRIAELVGESSPQAVVHLAAVGVTDPFLNYETAIDHNVLGTVNLVQSLFSTSYRDPGPRKIIIARTPGETSTMNVYAASKAAAWSFCSMFARTMGWSISGAFIFQAYGPGQAEQTLVPSAIAAARSGADLPMTTGMQKRDWIYVDDIADGLIAALRCEMPAGVSFDLGTGQTMSVASVAALIYEIVGKGGKPVIGAIPDRPGEDQIQMADTERTNDLIGWRSTTSVSEGLAKIIAGPRG
jgi:nucleoside-diphosphate-sugar epimerase